MEDIETASCTQFDLELEQVCQAAIEKVWATTIERHYNQTENFPSINSESALQAYFVAELLRELDYGPHGRFRVFVEPIAIPQLKTTQGRDKAIIPDVLVCSESDVLACIELKYLPRLGYSRELRKLPSFIKDSRSLQALAEHGRNGGAIMNHERYRGAFTSTNPLFFAHSAMLVVWCGVIELNDDDPPKEFAQSNSSVFRERFLGLIACTSNETPAVIRRFRYNSPKQTDKLSWF